MILWNFRWKKRKLIPNSRDIYNWKYTCWFSKLCINQFRLTALDAFVDGSFLTAPLLSHSLSLNFFFNDSLIRFRQMYSMPLELILEDRMSVWDPLWATLTNRVKFIREKKERGKEKEKGGKRGKGEEFRDRK